MTLSTQQRDQDSQYVLIAKLDNVRNVSTILKAIHSKDREVRATFPFETIIIYAYCKL